MATLTINITTVVDEDYDGNPVTIKKVTGDIDGDIIYITHSEEDTELDVNCKTNFKDCLTDLGYTWDTEA